MPNKATICLWVLNVRHDANIIVNSRLAGNKPSHFCDILAFLQENHQLFQFMAEEDPEFIRDQYLADAGLITNTTGQMDDATRIRELQRRELEEAQLQD